MTPLTIGQHVHLTGRYRRETEGTVSKIGRRWVTITTPTGEVRYDRYDRTEERAVGAASRFWTDEQYAALLREQEDERTLNAHGFHVDSGAQRAEVTAVAQLLRRGES